MPEDLSQELNDEKSRRDGGVLESGKEVVRNLREAAGIRGSPQEKSVDATDSELERSDGEGETRGS